MKIKLTVREAEEIGILEELMEILGWHEYALAEGLADMDTVMEIGNYELEEWKKKRRIKL